MVATTPRRKVRNIYKETLSITDINLWNDWQQSSGNLDQFQGIAKTPMRSLNRDPDEGQPFVLGGSKCCWIVRYSKSADRFILFGDYGKSSGSLINGGDWIIPLRL